MELKLNSLNRNMLDADDIDSSQITVNGKTIDRKEIVSTGRTLVCEFAGSRIARRPGVSFKSLLKDISYGDYSRAHSDALFMFCATQANKAVGKDAPASVEEAKEDISYAKNKTFLATLAAITKDVLQPVLFNIFSDVAAGGLMQWEAVPFGGAKEIEIRSNDVFLFEDSSWGSRSAPANYLYKNSITLNPREFQCNAKIKWYQDIVNGDAGYYYNAILSGMWNKIYAIFVEGLKAAAANTAYVPTGLTASGYSTPNWNTITTKVAALNGVSRADLIAFGGITQINKVLPTDGLGAAITGLQYGLGEEWFRRGYLPNASGVQIVEVEPVIVPGTQNSTIDTIDLGTNLFIAAKAGAGYAPMFGGYYEGSPITIEFDAARSADFTIDINCTAFFDIKPVFASKVGVITNVI